VATVAVLAPWEVLDRSVMGAWIPLTTQSGYVLAGTYNETSAADPKYPGDWRPPNENRADEAIITKRPYSKEVALDHQLESAALNYASRHPSYVLTVVYQNTRRLFDLESLFYTRLATYSSYGYLGIWGYAEEVAGLGALLLALVGAVVSIRRRRASLRRIPVGYWLVPIVLWLSTVVQEAFPRLRAMIDPFLVQFAAVAVVYFASRLFQRFPGIPVAARKAVGLHGGPPLGASRTTEP